MEKKNRVRHVPAEMINSFVFLVADSALKQKNRRYYKGAKYQNDRIAAGDVLGVPSKCTEDERETENPIIALENIAFTDEEIQTSTR